MYYMDTHSIKPYISWIFVMGEYMAYCASFTHVVLGFNRHTIYRHPETVKVQTLYLFVN